MLSGFVADLVTGVGFINMTLERVFAIKQEFIGV